MYSFVVLELKRNPAEFWDALHRIEEIAACRKALDEAGLQNQLPCRAMVYVQPEYYRRVLAYLNDPGITFRTGETLQLSSCSARHIIVGAELRVPVFVALYSMPGRGRLQIRSEGSKCAGLRDVHPGRRARQAILRITTRRFSRHMLQILEHVDILAGPSWREALRKSAQWVRHAAFTFTTC